ncbi:hypothetical protein [Actinoplanes aureus]|uniref:Uncharacterized protein n=1 Tax=Actinoplanes aureus TaxID=2792083 RepID=A0A931CKS7_9ACTN|nr:hypothetical protein [Actinoplanes aureus]MBG0568851.1 hypothetical protein [Actinoplanes aureus]
MAEELTDLVKARKDLVWGLYSDVRLHARHAEMLRSNVVNVMIVVASVLVAVIANDGGVERSELPLCVAVTLAGLIGLAFAASYTELFERNRRRAVRLRQHLDDEFFADGPASLASLLDEADVPHESSRLHRWTRGITGTTQRFWLLLPAAVLVAGGVLTAVAL